MYKTLGFRWLLEAYCPTSAFVSADSDEARNPQRFIHVTVISHIKRRQRKENKPISIDNKLMRNYLYYSISLISLLTGCHTSENALIQIQTTGFVDSTKICLMNLENEKIDTGIIISNNIEFSPVIDEPTRFVIYPVDSFDFKYFWVDSKHINILAENGKLENAKVEGSIIQKQADILNANKIQLELILDSLRNEYSLLSEADEQGKEALRSRRKEIEQALTDVDVKYIKANPNELFSAFTLKELMSYTIPRKLTNELYENLSKRVQSSKYGVLVKKFLDLSTDFKIGDKAIDFKLTDINGNNIQLSDFKGKYVLLDFWSSNCGVCLMENPVLLKNYLAFRDNGFEILGISLDKNKDDWRNTVQSDSMIWTTVSDLKGFDGNIPLTYHVYIIPTYYLINPDGIIIEKIEGRGKLEDKLKEIFDK